MQHRARACRRSARHIDQPRTQPAAVHRSRCQQRSRRRTRRAITLVIGSSYRPQSRCCRGLRLKRLMLDPGQRCAWPHRAKKWLEGEGHPPPQSVAYGRFRACGMRPLSSRVGHHGRLGRRPQVSGGDTCIRPTGSPDSESPSVVSGAALLLVGCTTEGESPVRQRRRRHHGQRHPPGMGGPPDPYSVAAGDVTSAPRTTAPKTSTSSS